MRSKKDITHRLNKISATVDELRAKHKAGNVPLSKQELHDLLHNLQDEQLLKWVLCQYTDKRILSTNSKRFFTPVSCFGIKHVYEWAICNTLNVDYYEATDWLATIDDDGWKLPSKSLLLTALDFIVGTEFEYTKEQAPLVWISSWDGGSDADYYDLSTGNIRQANKYNTRNRRALAVRSVLTT